MPVRKPVSDAPARLYVVPITTPDADVVVRTERTRGVFALAVFAACAFGALARVGFVLAADFPLNDGGMFFAMIRDLQASHYALPAYTSYNDAHIPYAYPPFAFYLAGAIDDLTPIGLIGVFRFLPLAACLLTMPAFLLLARRIVRADTGVAAAMFAFALMPSSFEWAIMGGGLTRSFGLLFTTLALVSLHALYTTKRHWLIAPAMLLCALTLLSHPETAWFLAISAAVFFVAYGRHQFGVIATAIVGTGAAVLSAPWWLTVLMRHGTSPFIAAMRTGSTSKANPILIFVRFDPTNEPLFALITALALLGVVACIARRQYMLPAWLLLAGLLEPRSFGRVGSLPVAMLAGIAVADVLLPMLQSHGVTFTHTERPSRMRLGGAAVAVCGVMLAYAFLGALVANPRNLAALSADERAGMQWVAANTPADARVLVVSNDSWSVDRTSEWFPVEAQRLSVATPQGYEWTGDGGFGRQLDAYRAAQLCAAKDGDCLAAWAASSGKSFDYVYVPKLAPHVAEHIDDLYECCAALRASLRTDARYQVVFDGAAATVFRRTV